MATSKILHTDPPRTFVVVCDRGDSVADTLLAFAEREQLGSASFTAIGGFSRATLAYFDVKTTQYEDIPVDEQVEVLTLAGDIVHGDDAGWRLHAHAVLGRRDGSTRGGHLRDAIVRPTLEVMVTESPRTVRRRHDPDTGLALIDLRDD